MLRSFVNHHRSDWDLYLVDVEVAYNRSPNAVTTYSTFFLNYGCEPSTVPADLHCSTVTNVASVSEWLQGLSKGQAHATDGITTANDARAHYANRRRHPCSIVVGDLVHLSTKNLMPDAYQGAKE